MTMPAWFAPGGHVCLCGVDGASGRYNVPLLFKQESRAMTTPLACPRTVTGKDGLELSRVVAGMGRRAARGHEVA
jgi:hypothetical protein